ncbi:gallinacin-9-like [Sphaerodactylus townsendi]|uniref:gallinacin-9-like n=1 Tax=Sphaerodactylus townsendi TaxID=933632 RepID=UPI00202635E2|nr:gallinacin-9-like [Sphaerodactylus townsendi]
MKILSFLSGVLFFVLMAVLVFSAAPRTASDCDKAGGKCMFLTCKTNYTSIGSCDKNGGVCCKKNA